MVGTNRTLSTRTQEKGAVIPQETDPDLPVSTRSFQRRSELLVACCRVGVTECSSACMGSFEEVIIIFITSITVWPQIR